MANTRPRRNRRVTVLICAAATLAASLVVAPVARADETTIGYDATRMNWDRAEPGLVSTAIRQPDFGQLWAATLPGTTGATPNQIYAQPIVADGMVIVVTEENEVVALNPGTGALIWSRSLGTPWTPTPACGDLVPHVGTTATPVYDPATKTIYLVAKNAVSGNPAAATISMHALQIEQQGAEASGWPIPITGTSTNGNEPFDATTANPRPGLLLMGAAVYFASASHCDHGPYVGFVGRVALSGSPSLKLWSSESGSATAEAGIWQSGGGLVSDGPGRILLATGNGVSPAPGPGSSPPGTLGESVVRLAVAADGTMTAQDYFSPANNAKLNQDDEDLGAGGPVALPDDYGSGSHPHLLVVAGKDGTVFLLDRDSLGGTAQGPGGSDATVSSTLLKGVWGRAAVFDSGTRHLVYLLPSTAPLEALTVSPNGANQPTLTTIAASAASYAYTSGSPVVTSDGTTSASAVVWIVAVDSASGTNGRLVAYPAVPPTSGAWLPIASYPLGLMAKFVQPATDGGRVFVGTRDGRVLAFGRPTTAAINAPPTDFGQQAVGAAPITETVTVAAASPAEVNSVSVSGASFAVGAPTPVLPVHLSAGQTLSVPVTFTPTVAGATNGTLSVNATPDGAAPADYPFSLSAIATDVGVAAQPNTLNFGEVPLGQAAQLGVTLQNTNNAPATITNLALADPGGNGFALVDGLTLPYALPALGSVTVTVRFTPTQVNPATSPAQGSLSVTSTDAAAGTDSSVVPLIGQGSSGTPVLGFAGPLVHNNTLAFGQVAPGSTVTTTFTVQNVGTAMMVINKAAPPAAPYTVPTPISEGQQLAPGDLLTTTISVTPTSAEPVTQTYSVTTNDGSGPHLLTLTLNAGTWSGPVKSHNGCLTVRGGIAASHTPIVLSPCTAPTSQTMQLTATHGIQWTRAGFAWCVDVPGSATRPGIALQLYVCNSTVAQQWILDSAGRIVNPHSRLCLDTTGVAGTPLVLTICSAALSQRWDASALLATRGLVSSGVGALNQYCLTDPGASTRSGAPFTLATCTIAAGQIITRVGNSLRVGIDCLSATAARSTAPVTVQLCTGGSLQLWTFGPYGRVYNPVSKLCLDDPHSTTVAGTPLWVYTCNGTPAQRWTLPG